MQPSWASHWRVADLQYRHMADEGVVLKGELLVEEGALLVGGGWGEVEGIVLGILDTLGRRVGGQTMGERAS